MVTFVTPKRSALRATGVITVPPCGDLRDTGISSTYTNTPLTLNTVKRDVDASLSSLNVHESAFTSPHSWKCKTVTVVIGFYLYHTSLM